MKINRDALRQARIRAGLDQRALAARITALAETSDDPTLTAITPQTISQLERHPTRNARPSTLHSIAAALDVPIDMFLIWDDDDTDTTTSDTPTVEPVEPDIDPAANPQRLTTILSGGE